MANTKKKQSEPLSPDEVIAAFKQFGLDDKIKVYEEVKLSLENTKHETETNLKKLEAING